MWYFAGTTTIAEPIAVEPAHCVYWALSWNLSAHFKQFNIEYPQVVEAFSSNESILIQKGDLADELTILEVVR